jgi:ATPase subunit of ABC transporter with duplicated ATPase domains
VDELISEGLCMFTDKDDEHGTIDLDKCGEEANLYRTKKAVADRRLAAAKKKEEAQKKAEADRLAKAKAAAAARRQEEERLARLQKADADLKAKKKASAGKSGGKDSKASKASTAPRGAGKPNPSGLKRVISSRPSEPNDSGAEMLMAAAALMDSGEEVDLNGTSLTGNDARVIARSAKRHKGGAFDKTTAPPSVSAGAR